jgi:hypothetical protein
MTDTSGRSGFGRAGSKIRTALKQRFAADLEKVMPPPVMRRARTRPGGGGGGAPGGGSTIPIQTHPVPPVPGTVTPVPTTILRDSYWRNLDEADRLQRVLLPLDLLYYLREMARFSEIARSSGLPGVVKEFEIRDTSSFFILRRGISSRAPHNSEHQTRAAKAFNKGATRWAEELTGIADPLAVTVSKVVETIRAGNTVERALILSARLILQEYVELVICRPLKKDDEWAPRAKDVLLLEFRAQLDDFFRKHDSAAEWRSAAIARTLKQFPRFLLEE